MKTHLNKICKATASIVLTAFMLVNITAPAFAQTQSQQDAEEFLDALGVEYVTDEYGQIIVDGDLSLSRKGLTKLPDLSNVIVKGSFNASHNNLTTLKGAPKEVGGDFDVLMNQLRTLEGAPEIVGGDFLALYNKLTTLEGAPKEVGGVFFIDPKN
jgi:hypothetical protein